MDFQEQSVSADIYRNSLVRIEQTQQQQVSSIIMGNSFNPGDLTREYEYISGKKLMRAIKANSRVQMEESYEMAKAELLPKSKSTTHDKEYENMIKQMTLYLTRGYNVGDGVLFLKTPLEVAEENHSDQAISFIRAALEQLQKHDTGKQILEDKGLKIASTNSVGQVDKERVHQAKERLKQFQKNYEEQKKK